MHTIWRFSTFQPAGLQIAQQLQIRLCRQQVNVQIHIAYTPFVLPTPDQSPAEVHLHQRHVLLFLNFHLRIASGSVTFEIK